MPVAGTGWAKNIAAAMSKNPEAIAAAVSNANPFMNTGAMAAAQNQANAQAAAQAANAYSRLQQQVQLQEQVSNLKTLARGPRNLILNQFGQEVDEMGKVIASHAAPVQTMKVNLKKNYGDEYLDRIGKNLKSSSNGNGSKGKGKGPEEDVNGPAQVKSTKYFDPALRISGAGSRDKRRMKMEFNFVVDNKYKIEQEKRDADAEKNKKKEETEKQNKLAAAAAEGAALGADGKPLTGGELVAMGTKTNKAAPAPIPTHLEWWDMNIMGGDQKINLKKITQHVEHPVPIKPVLQKAGLVKKAGQIGTQMKEMMTPAERKKLRRRNRQDKAAKLRDQVKMGLIKPPPPKIGLANLMRVMGDEQIANPTGVERQVKAQTEQRRKEHEERNSRNQLSVAEKKLRKKQKWDGNTINGPAPSDNPDRAPNMTHTLVFQLSNLANKKHLYKIDINAQQFQLTGACIMCAGIGNILVCEGGARSIKRYKKLIMRRIKWEKEDDDDDEAEDDEDYNAKSEHFHLMWEGTTAKRQFNEWKMHTVKTENEGRSILVNRNCEHVSSR